MIKIIFAEDDTDFVYLIQEFLKNESDFEVLGYADNKDDAISLAQKLKPDIVLMDLNLSSPYLDGIDAAKQIRLTTDAKVLLLTSFYQPDIIIEASKKAFASGYIFKSQYGQLPGMIRATAAGSTPQEEFIRALIVSELSVAEKTVLELIMGKHVEISSSEKTIANQKTQIFKKMGLRNSNEILHVFKRYG